MTPRSPRRPGSRSTTGRRRRWSETGKAKPQGGIEEVAERAARLGITPERVLVEYARIAFADPRHFVEAHNGAISIRPLDELDAADAAAISEIVPGSQPGRSRVKLHNKKAALDAIARHLGMFPLPARRRDDEVADSEAEDPRDFLARELARLAAGGGEE